MTVTKHPKIYTVLLILAGLGLCFSGCINLHKKFPDIRIYALDLSEQGHVSYADTPVSIRVNPFPVVPAFADRYLTYRTGETAYEQDFYNQLMTAPAEMIRDQASSWLKNSPLVSFVLTLDSQSQPDYVLDGKLLDLSADYREENNPKAVLKMQWTISSMGQDNPEVLFQKIYTAEISMNSPSPEALTKGWNRGLGQVMVAFEGDFQNLLSKQCKGQ